MDWQSRKVLSWRLFNTMETHFCIEALEEALTQDGVPEIFNTNQGSQFTSCEFTAVLKAHGIKISMAGKDRWMDNVFIERLWRSPKYGCVYLHGFENGSQVRTPPTLAHGSVITTTHGLIRRSMDKCLMRLISLICRGLTLKMRSKRHNINQINCSLTWPQTCPMKWDHL
ncbi:transposase [Nitrospira sp. T9]|uniref:transposase n=1 Tax=unclassified Nitrospira TaxID=2652172 RepID=UPI003F9B5D9B